MAGTASSGRLQVDDRIGQYRIEGEVAADTTGVVYRAVHQVLPRRALIKVMHAASVYPRVVHQPLAVHVLREACILEALHHPGIIRLFESGMLDDKRPWFARELVEGPTLASIVPPRPFDRVDTIVLLRDLAEVLDHAYRRGVIHCGLRPDRVVLAGRTRGFSLCVIDWTDARAHDAAPAPFVPTGPSWHYTSPELANGEQIDDRSDVFALGVLSYQVLTGTLPFENGAIALDVQGAEHCVPTEVRCPDAPRELTALVDSMIAYNRFDRPSISEVYADLTWLADALAAPAPRPAHLVRIRRPRWTPALDFDKSDIEQLDISATPERENDKG